MRAENSQPPTTCRLSIAVEPSLFLLKLSGIILYLAALSPNCGLWTFLFYILSGNHIDCFLGRIIYVPMDLTLKNKSWAGNIYHQFESFCQDVDDFMSKDTVRFVGNQVQSVKRLYSNAVQVHDILPLSVHENQLSKDQGSIGNFRKSGASMATELDSGLDENITRVSVPLAGDFISDCEIMSGASNAGRKNSMRNMMHEKGLITVETGRRASNHVEENKGFSDDNISSSDLLFESKLALVENPNYNENGSFSDSSASALKDGTLCDISSRDGSFDMLSSVQSSECLCVDIVCDEEEGKEIGRRSLSCSTSPKSNGSAYNVSSPDVDLLIFGSNENALVMDGSEFVGGLSENEMFRQSETGNTSDGFVITEAMDLSLDVMHDEARLILNGNPLHTAYHGKRDFRYYKKLIQDTLTSQKRLSKEYEHLVILYGDIDLELSQHFEPNPVPTSTKTPIHAARTQSSHEMSETEWELV
ncbi:hypothetical protein OROGR_015302 [Orobanche gracilis]